MSVGGRARNDSGTEVWRPSRHADWQPTPEPNGTTESESQDLLHGIFPGAG